MGELNAISLFSGIGGFELGLGDYCRTVLYCEADPHAQAVLLSRMLEGKIDIAPIARIKRLGNAVVPLQVKTAFEYLMGIIRPPVPAYVDYEEVDFC